MRCYKRLFYYIYSSTSGFSVLYSELDRSVIKVGLSV